MKTCMMFLMFVFSLPVFAVSSPHCPQGCPTGTTNSNINVLRNAYTLSNNGSTKFADWVAYKVSAATIGGGRNRSWRADPELSARSTLEPSDYNGAHAALATDRGHQAPLASLSAFSDWRALNYLSNITPQSSALNQGPWRILEERVRNLITSGGIGSVYVATGPLYEYNFADLPGANERHTIPSGYWKVVYVNNGSIQTAAFIMDQSTPRNSNMCNQVVTINQVESRSGLNLFPNMPNQGSIERRLGDLRDDLGC